MAGQGKLVDSVIEKATGIDGASRVQVSILSLAMVVISLGFGIVIPIFPFYVERLGGGGKELGLLVAVAALTELVFGPMWGRLSDRIGRKPVLVTGMAGYGISSLLFGLATKLWMLFVFRALSGVLSSATAAGAMAYIGDSTSEKARGGGMGMIGAAGGLGLVLGPAVGGLLATVSLATPFFASAAVSFLTVLLLVLRLPESLPAPARDGIAAPATGKALPAWANLRPVAVLLFMAFLVSFGLANFEAVFGLYALKKFGFGPEQVGAILAVVGLVSTAGKIFTGGLTSRWGDEAVIKVSLFTGSLGFLVLLAANTYVTVLLATGFFVLSKTFLRPAVFSLTSRRSTTGQGVAMGLSNSFVSLGRIVGPVWAGYVFDLNYNYPYLSGAAIMFAGFLIGLALISRRWE